MREEERHASYQATQLWRDIKASFPYLPKPTIISRYADDIYDSVAHTLARIPSFGTIAGTGIPAPAIPASGRRRHLYVVGKTGSGKSTFLEHLIANDLKSGRGIGVVAPEAGLFRDRLLPLVPRGRLHDVVYFAPADPSCPVSLNPLSLAPGEDSARAAQDLFTIFARSLGEDGLGVRMEPIIQNVFAALVGQPGTTLKDARRFLDDERYRTTLLSGVTDEYTRVFWRETFPRFPKGAALPLITRLDRFLRPKEVQRALCTPQSSFSLRDVLKHGRILFVDFFGLSERVMLLFGQLLLAKFQLELMRRERVGEGADPFFLYADEFQSFGGVAEATWRELLSRGRKYGLALTLAHQYPAQLPTGLQNEVRNANSLMAFRLSSKDADAVRGQFIHKRADGSLEQLRSTSFVELPVGTAYASVSGGRAVQIQVPPPIKIRPSRYVLTVIKESWQRFGIRHEAGAYETTYEASPSKESRESTPLPDEPAPHVPDKAALHEPQPKHTEPIPSKDVDVSYDTQTRQREEPQTHAPSIDSIEQAHEARLAQPGRGGPEHLYLQELIKGWGHDLGFRADIEKQLPNGGRIDVALVRAEKRIAIEISVTTSARHELHNIKKCLASGWREVVVVSARKRFLGELEKRVREAFPEDERALVQLMTPEDCYTYLETFTPDAPTETFGGYKVNVSYREPGRVETQAQRRAVADVIKKSLKRLGRTKR